MSTPTSVLQPKISRIPPEIFCAEDYELLASRSMALPTYEYIAGGSGKSATVDANRAAFLAWEIFPRLLRDLSAGHTRTKILDHEFRHPILLAPVAFQSLAHPLGEIESARAAQATESVLCSSTLSSCRLEDIACNADAGHWWFQLYLQPNRDDTLQLLRRAERAGAAAIVLTLDASIQAASLRALNAGFRMPADCVAVNLEDHSLPLEHTVDASESRILQGLMRDAPKWPDIDWLLSETELPVWVKGVLHANDARALKDRGIAGQVVSNHGGRSLDGAPASLRMLPLIRAAVGDAYPLILDGGIRSGNDVFKALALGANAVMIGRLQVYALAVAGALGVAHMVKLLREELEACMALAGCATLAEINANALTPAPSTKKITPC